MVNFPFHEAEMSSQLTLSLSLFHVFSMWSLTLKRLHARKNDQAGVFPTTLNCYLVSIKIQEKVTTIVIFMFKIIYKTHLCAGLVAHNQS